MNVAKIQQNWRFSRLVAGKLALRAGSWARLPWLLARQAVAQAPKRLLIAPQDIRTADATIAEDIYAGHFAFSGRMVNSHGASPFDLDPPNAGWARELAGFGWLRHLRAANSALARANAQALVQDFMVSTRRSDALADEPRVLARRILSWLSQSPIILENADRAFYQRFMKSLGKAQVRLQRLYINNLSDDARLLAAIALTAYALCAQVSANAQKKASQRLARELSRQILPDGGHISRNPRMLVAFLLDLLPLRQAYAARAILAPPQLLNSIDRMMPMLRMMRHGDGMLALFNGMGATAPDLVATVLACDDAQAQPLSNARQSGYQRLEAGASLVIADMGIAPPPAFSGEAHAGCLAFEFSSSDQRLIVNCGAPDAQRVEARALVRATAAHSTLIVADTSSCHVAQDKGLEGLASGQIIAGPNRVTISRGADETGIFVEAGHDGYVAMFDLVHTRRLHVSADGGALTGRDGLQRTGRMLANAEPFALRFHLHPNVRAQLSGQSDRVLLTLENAENWLFEAGGLTLELEESIFFGGAFGARACEQIVLQAIVETDAQINWSLTRQSAGL